MLGSINPPQSFARLFVYWIEMLPDPITKKLNASSHIPGGAISGELEMIVLNRTWLFKRKLQNCFALICCF